MRVFGFVQGILDQSASVGVAIVVLMRGGVRMFTAGEEKQAGKRLQPAMVDGRQPEGQHCPHSECSEPTHAD